MYLSLAPVVLNGKIASISHASFDQWLETFAFELNFEFELIAMRFWRKKIVIIMRAAGFPVFLCELDSRCQDGSFARGPGSCPKPKLLFSIVDSDHPDPRLIGLLGPDIWRGTPGFGIT